VHSGWVQAEAAVPFADFVTPLLDSRVVTAGNKMNFVASLCQPRTIISTGPSTAIFKGIDSRALRLTLHEPSMRMGLGAGKAQLSQSEAI